MEAVVALINDLKDARAQGKTDAQLDLPRKLQRRAQFMLDFVEAENSTGFHAPEEAQRILAESIDYARQGQLALRGVPVAGLGTREAVKPMGGGPAERK
jgi:nitrite reductase (cytochrome c-552)